MSVRLGAYFFIFILFYSFIPFPFYPYPLDSPGNVTDWRWRRYKMQVGSRRILTIDGGSPVLE